MKIFSILAPYFSLAVSLSTYAQFESAKEIYTSPKLK